MESRIKASLRSLLDAIKRAEGDIVVRETVQLDELLERGRAEQSLHPQLEHFLEKRSYAKALAFLGGEAEIPSGACGGRSVRG